MKTNLRKEVADLQQANLVKLLIILVLLIAGVVAGSKIIHLRSEVRALKNSETQVVAKLDTVCEVVLDQRRLLHGACRGGE